MIKNDRYTPYVVSLYCDIFKRTECPLGPSFRDSKCNSKALEDSLLDSIQQSAVVIRMVDFFFIANDRFSTDEVIDGSQDAVDIGIL